MQREEKSEDHLSDCNGAPNRSSSNAEKPFVDFTEVELREMSSRGLTLDDAIIEIERLSR